MKIPPLLAGGRNFFFPFMIFFHFAYNAATIFRKAETKSKIIERMYEKMKAIINKVLCAILALCTVLAISSTAFAADNISMTLVKELFLNENAEITVASVEEASVRREVQAYVDAISTKSETPTVEASILKSSMTLKLSLSSTTEEFTEEELKSLCSSAGTAVESIDAFIKGKLSYDKEAAANSKALTLASSQLTAKGALSTGKAVCQGYANLFTLLAEQAGFQSVKVRGYVDGVYHVMNVVLASDGTYMAADVTFNDSSNNSWSLINFSTYCEKINFVPAIDVETAFALKYAD